MSYWFIDGKAYDFSSFNHPGGSIALELGKDRDTTELYRSYHPFSNRPDAMLSKYSVRDGSENEHTPKTKSIFDWSKKSEFFEELRAEVKTELKNGTDTKATPERWFQLLVLYTIAIICTIQMVKGEWWALFVAPIACWFAGVNSFHDASHFAMSSNWRVNAFITYIHPWFSSPFTWYHQHVIGHHCYTNVYKHDPDMHHSARIWRYTRRSKHLKHHRWQMYYFILVWMMITTSLAFIIDTLFFVKGSYHGIVKMVKITNRRKLGHYFGRFLTVCLLYVWPYVVFDSYVKAYLFATVPMWIFGACFSFSSQLNHLTPENMDKSHDDYYKHQVVTSHTFCPKSLFWFFFTGGLNLQIEHHLFPGVNHWQLRRIQPIVQRICEKHGVEYNLSPTVKVAFGKHMALLDELSRDNRRSD